MSKIKQATVTQYDAHIIFEDGKEVRLNSDARRLHAHFSGLGSGTKIVPGERCANNINLNYVPFDPPPARGFTVHSSVEIDCNRDGSMQVRLSTPFGLIDLVFEDVKQMRQLVAGQHLPTFDTMMAEAKG